MHTLEIQEKNCISNIKDSAKDFVYSLFFPAILSLFVLLFWIADLQLLGTAVVCLSGAVILVFFEDITPSIPAFLLLGMSFRDSNSIPTSIPAITLMVIFGLAIIFNLVRFPIKKVKFDSLCLCLTILTAVLLISGIFSPYFIAHYFQGLPLLVTIGVCPLIIHFFTINRVKYQKQYNNVNYFCYSFMFAVNTACLQLLYASLYNIVAGDKVFQVPGNFGWTNTNHIANLILISVPICFYLISKSKNIYPLLIQLVFFYFSSFASQSDGALAVLVIFTPALLFKTQLSILPKNRIPFRCFWLLAITVCLVGLIYFVSFMPQDAQKFFEKMLSDSGRSPLYEKAWQTFIQFPIFGTGVGHSATIAGEKYGFTMHSTLFFAISSGGLLCLGAYVYLYFSRINSLNKNGNNLAIFLIIATMMFLGYGLIDNGECDIVLVYYTIAVSFALTQKKQAEIDYSLPAFKKYRLFS